MPRKIKVAHLSDMPFGGAAVAAQRLVQGLADADAIEVEHWVFGNDESPQLRTNQVALEKNCPKTTLERVVRVFSRSGAKALQRSRQRKALLSAIATQRPDILHLHNLHASALQHEDLALIPPHIRLVWTMHDCCSFAPWAYRWQSEKGTEEIQGEERRPAALSERQRFFANRRDLVLVSPSHWLAQEARGFVGESIRIEVIPYGVPTAVFAPQHKTEAKSALGLNPNRIWLGLAAASFDHRKGADIFVQGLRMMSRKDLGVLLWGNEAGFPWPEAVEVRSVGYVSNEQEMALLYSACDLFVCPSRIDNLPNTILESMACGTAVVGSKVGGIPDMIFPNETGWLYAPNQAQACFNTLLEAFDQRELWPAYGARCRKVTEEQFSMNLQAKRFGNLYQQIPVPNKKSFATLL